jgi:CubicO group peptidase (beta-lactamase class C family)
LAVAGFAIEAVTGKTLDEYLQEVICKPLGLKHTTFGDAPAGTPETISQRATMSDPTTEWIQTSDWLLPLKKSCCGTGGSCAVIELLLKLLQAARVFGLRQTTWRRSS